MGRVSRNKDKNDSIKELVIINNSGHPLQVKYKFFLKHLSKVNASLRPKSPTNILYRRE